MSLRSRRSFVVVVALVGLLAAACGGGSDDAAAPSTTEADDALAFSTTTTTAPPSTTTSAPSTTTTIPGPVAPLTGLPLADRIERDRPALAVKIDNHPRARPQVGLHEADLVFDLRAEGVTRFMAVYHSELPTAVGPVRSSRTSDFDLVRGLDHPLYASSGGNDYVMNGLRSLPVHALTNHSRSEYYRDSSRPAPHNLFIDPNVLYTVVADAVAEADDPDPWFLFRSPGDALAESAEPAAGPVSVDFTNSPTVDFEWSDERAGWLRSQDGVAHETADGLQLAPTNVVILVTTYGTSAADAGSPEVRSTGSGEALVLTDGHLIAGSWSRPDAADAPQLVDVDGNPIELTAGQTWILYPEQGQIAR